MVKLILISKPLFFEGEIELLISFFENGLRYFHLRKPECSKDEMHSFLTAIPEKYHQCIVIHSHYALCTEFAIKGIHCTAKGRDEFYNFEHVSVQKSISTHGFCEAGMVDETFAYAFISPIFDSISKPGYQQGYNHEALQQFLHRPRKTEFIALGGITESNIELCKRLGFDGVAIIGSIWEHQNPIEQLKRILLITQQL